MRLKIVGTASGHDAIGAAVEVEAGGVTHRRLVTPTHGYLSQSDPTITIGLGGRAPVTRVRVQWPSGAVLALSGVPSNAVTTVTEPQ